MEKIDEIEEKIRRGKEYFQPLWGRYDDDFDLWRIKERSFDTHPGAINRTSNRARALSDKCQGYLARSKMDIQVKPPGSLPSPESIALSSKIERMLKFAFYEADKRLLRLQKPDLKNALIWHINNRGRAAIRVLIRKEGDRIIWDFLPLDPRHLVFEMGGDDIAWFAYRTWRSPLSIKDNFGIEIEDKKKPVEVWDYWDRKDNAVICYQTPYTNKASNTLKPSTEHNLSRPPISLITVPTNPSVFDETGITIKFDGESIYASNRELYKQTDKTASMLATHMSTLVNQPIIHFYDPSILGEDGKPITIDKSLSYPGAIANVPNTHKFADTPRRDIPRALEMDYTNMIGDQQRATFADVEYGIDQPPHSGTALSLLREDKNKVLLPRLQTLQFSYSDTCQNTCEQLREQGITVTSKIISKEGEYNIEEVTPEELEDAKDFYINVNFVLSYPYEDMQTLGLIEMAVRQGIISVDTAREDMAKVPDTEAEKDKIAIERVSANMPEIDSWRAIKALRKAGRDFEADAIDHELEVRAKQREAAIQQSQGIPPGGMPETSGMPQGGA